MTEGAYTFSKVASGYDVAVAPAPPPAIPPIVRAALYGGVVIGGGMILVGLLTLSGGGPAVSGGVVAILLGAAFAGFFYGLRTFMRRLGTNQRTSVAFGIGPTELSVAGATIAIPDIQRFVLRNRITRQETPSGAWGPGAAASAAQALAMPGEIIGVSARAQLARVSWRVEVEAGGKPTTLGCGLDVTSARGLAQETMRRIAEIRAA